MPTIKEIAKLANVSIGTVDRVIHNRGRVSQETRAKIKKIIKDIDYKPNVFARNLRLSKTFNFGVLMPHPSQDSRYWELPLKGIRKAARELIAHMVKIEFFHYDKYSEISFKEIEQAIEENQLDGLLIAPVISKLFRKFIDKLPPGFPYVLFDTCMAGTNCISYVGQDSYQSGVLSARLMQLLVPEAGAIAIVKYLPEDDMVESKIDGFKKLMQENNDLRLVTYGVREIKGFREYDKVARQILAENNDLRGIFVAYPSAYKIAKYIKSSSPEKKISIIGYSRIPENIELLKQGAIDFLISQMPKRQGYEGIYALYNYIVLKEKVEPTRLMQIDIIARENVDYILE